MKEVVIYTSQTCPHCTTAKAHLDRMGISYTEKRVDVDDRARAEIQQMGAMGVPTLKINGQVMIGFNPQELNKMLTKQLVTCPECGQKLRVPAEQGTLKVTCSKCQNQFVTK